MCNILYFVISFIIGWIFGSLMIIIKKGKPGVPLMTPEERYMYKTLRKSMNKIREQVNKYEELINGQSTKTKRKGR